jgi:cell division protein ZapA
LVQKNKVQVRIAGKDYALVGVESDEYIQKVGLYIDKKMNEVMRNNNKLSTSLAAVLTAVNVADDYFKIYESEANFKKQLSEALNELKTLREEKKRLLDENEQMNKKATELQLELAKREAELREVRNSLEKFTGQKR